MNDLRLLDHGADHFGSYIFSIIKNSLLNLVLIYKLRLSTLLTKQQEVDQEIVVFLLDKLCEEGKLCVLSEPHFPQL